MSKLEWHGKKIERQVEAIAMRGLDKAAILTANTAQRSMETAKHGAKVPPGQGSRGGHPWQKTRRSAPGEAPAVQTGRLRNSIAWVKPSPLVRLVGTNVKYGRAQELGYKPNNLEPRPYLLPAFKKNKKIIEQEMKGKL